MAGMKDIGLGPIADRIADIAMEAARGKKSAAATRRRIAVAVFPLVGEAAIVGVDQSLIAARAPEHASAALAIAARKAELLAK